MVTYNKAVRKVLACVLAVTLLCSSLVSGSVAQARTDTTVDDYEEEVGTYSINGEIPRFTEYNKLYPDTRPQEQYVIDAKDYVSYTLGEVDGDGNEVEVTPESYENYEGNIGTSIYSGESGLVEYEVTIKTGGYYDLSILYYPIEGKNSAIQRSFFIDGELPYEELAAIEFSRIWKNSIEDTVTDIKGVVVSNWEQDNQGNDLKPSLVEAPEWVSSYLYDSTGYVTDQLSVYLEEGTHTITILSRKEPMLLRSITLDNKTELKSYEEVLKDWESMGASDTKDIAIRIEAETVNRTSSQMLYPIQEQSGAIYPSDPKELRNNTIGGNSWRLVGQWIEWTFDVEESGYYNISLHDKQNFVRGIYVSRKISIDGQVPFEELSDYGFRYGSNWRVDTLGNSDGDPFKFYLEKGSHTLRMEAVLGEFSTIISEVQEAVTMLNSVYRKMIRITGVKPDKYIDYQIERNLPNLKEEIIKTRDTLDGAIQRLREVAGRGSDKEAVLVTMRDQLDDLIENVEYFPRIVTNFKVNVRACGNWVTQALSQPLQVDSIYITSPEGEVDVNENSFWEKIWYEIQRLFYSFVVDYNQIGNVAGEKEEGTTITLWVGTGRDQANVIKSLIDETFTKEEGVNVNVMLVDMSTLLQATLAGQGPDVAINCANDLPMNYGLRNAVADLSQFPDLEEVKQRFNESAMVAFEFENHTYALPETQTFPMMFYRKDILKEIGLELPKTWDDVKASMAILNNNQMEIGMLASEQTFAMFLYQNGGQYYTEDKMASALDSDQAVNAFKQYCEYYTDYKLDRETSVEERFRTGEAPIIIADYTVYNNLQVSAPDIKGLWGFAPVPGVEREDGTIDNTVASSGLSCVIMEQSEEKEASWKFLKWWTSTETQTMYGREMESLMGASARVATANMEAFQNLPWPVADYEALSEQFKTVVGIPQVPGGYFSWRNVNNAFYKVVTYAEKTSKEKTSPREELMNKVILVNDEITFKRIEFNLPYIKE